jgi:hypothetical protein
MPRHAALAVLLAVVPAVLVGCSDAADPSDTVTDSRPVQVATVSAGEANLVLFVTNVIDRSDRIRIDVNGERAVDATFPAAAGRSHPPIFAYRFALPEGRTAVRVRTPRETKVVRFTLRADKRWVVMQNQNDDPERIPMDLTVHDERPLFG